MSTSKLLQALLLPTSLDFCDTLHVFLIRHRMSSQPSICNLRGMHSSLGGLQCKFPIKLMEDSDYLCVFWKMKWWIPIWAFRAKALNISNFFFTCLSSFSMHSISIVFPAGWKPDKCVPLITESGSFRSKFDWCHVVLLITFLKVPFSLRLLL